MAQWDGSKITGPILYQSGNQTYAGGGFQTYNFNTGSLALTPAQKYALFLNASSSPSDSFTSQAAILFTGGDLIYTSGNFDALTTTPWDLPEKSNIDLAFTASFSPTVAVPEPLTILGAMTATGFGAIFKRKLAQKKTDKKD